MLRYFRWQTTIPLEKFIPSSWQHWRAGDNLDTIYWLRFRLTPHWNQIPISGSFLDWKMLLPNWVTAIPQPGR
jgi:hypothetical protein